MKLNHCNRLIAVSGKKINPYCILVLLKLEAGQDHTWGLNGTRRELTFLSQIDSTGLFRLIFPFYDMITGKISLRNTVFMVKLNVFL